jgi:hypothetical protein
MEVSDEDILSNPMLMIPALMSDLDSLKTSEAEINALLQETQTHVSELKEASKTRGARGSLAYIHMQTSNMITMINSKVSSRKAIVDTRQKIISNIVKLTPEGQSKDGLASIPKEVIEMLMGQVGRNSSVSNPHITIHEGEYVVNDSSMDDVLDSRLDAFEEVDTRPKNDRLHISVDTAPINVEDTLSDILKEINDAKLAVVDEIVSDEELIEELNEEAVVISSSTVEEDELDEDDVSIIAGSDGNWYVIDDEMNVLNDEFEVDMGRPPVIANGAFGIQSATDEDGEIYPVIDLSDLVFKRK